MFKGFINLLEVLDGIPEYLLKNPDVLRTGMTPNEGLTLLSKDGRVWSNTSGFATCLVVDFQTLAACKRAASKTVWQPAECLWASEVIKSQTSSRIQNLMRQSILWRGFWAEVVKSANSIGEVDRAKLKLTTYLGILKHIKEHFSDLTLPGALAVLSKLNGFIACRDTLMSGGTPVQGCQELFDEIKIHMNWIHDQFNKAALEKGVKALKKLQEFENHDSAGPEDVKAVVQVHYCASAIQSCTAPHNIPVHYKSLPSVSTFLYGFLQFLSSDKSADELLKLNKVLAKSTSDVPDDPKLLKPIWEAVVAMTNKVQEACTKRGTTYLRELIAKVGPNDLKMKEMSAHLHNKAATC